LPRNNPGPGTYRPEDGEKLEFKNKTDSLAPGFSFPHDGMDGYGRKMRVSSNPPPTAYDLPDYKPRLAKSFR
jgi:hypothetical protein